MYFFSGKNAKVSTLAETALGLETSAIHLHGGILERDSTVESLRGVPAALSQLLVVTGHWLGIQSTMFCSLDHCQSTCCRLTGATEFC